MTHPQKPAASRRVATPDEQRAAQDFRNWADWLLSSSEDGAAVRALLLEAHRAAVRAYLGADGDDNVAFCAWEIVMRLDDALALKNQGSTPADIGKASWRRMQGSVTDIRRIPLAAWLTAVEQWQGRAVARNAAKGRSRAGSYDYRSVVHGLLNLAIEGRTTTRASAFKKLDRMPWEAHSPGVATTFRAFKTPRSKGPFGKKS